VAYQARAYPDFSSMKQLGVFLLPPGWDASSLQGYPPFIHLVGERHCESKSFCPSAQYNVPSHGSNLDRLLRVEYTDHEATVPPYMYMYIQGGVVTCSNNPSCVVLQKQELSVKCFTFKL